jgi:hypothetical protein
MRTTVTLNDKVYRALKLRAAQSDETISAIIEAAVQNQLLEDLEDIEDALSRQNEPVQSFDKLVAEFKAEGLI